MKNNIENQAIEVRKPKKVITITTNQITATQIKAFNYILREFYYKAKNSDPMKTYLNFTYSEIQKAIGASKTNNKQMFEELKPLTKISVEYLNGNDWGAFNLVSSVEKMGDNVEIALPPPLLRELFAKNYTILDLVKIKAMRSKYSLLMYEWAEKYRKEYFPIFPLWTIDELKKLLGVIDKKKYNNFFELQDRVLRPAIKELEEVTGIKLTYTLVKKGVKYETIQFSATYPSKKLTQEQKEAKNSFKKGTEIYKNGRIEEIKKQIRILEKQQTTEYSPATEMVISVYKKELDRLEPNQKIF